MSAAGALMCRRVLLRLDADIVDGLQKGEFDLVQVPEPFAQALVEEGHGHIWYETALRGPCCYTTFCAKRSFIDTHQEEVSAVYAAQLATLEWVRDETLDDALRIMESRQVRRLPVINKDKRMVGMLSLGDVSQAASHELSIANARDRRKSNWTPLDVFAKQGRAACFRLQVIPKLRNVHAELSAIGNYRKVSAEAKFMFLQVLAGWPRVVTKELCVGGQNVRRKTSHLSR